ncbi:hypothetical protein E5288_WYG006193 [Bos mutus]|uniref:Uncharacterized protein n=1 Tax=Bos mutus TaxID=72004 RepID=A0A6B0QYX1_9CETA|nr:hypothetical protein [Bos mutus]
MDVDPDEEQKEEKMEGDPQASGWTPTDFRKQQPHRHPRGHQSAGGEQAVLGLATGMHNLNASPFLIKEREGILQKPFACQNLSLPNFTFKHFSWIEKVYFTKLYTIEKIDATYQ